jgi:hypothetical protein
VSPNAGREAIEKRLREAACLGSRGAGAGLYCRCPAPTARPVRTRPGNRVVGHYRSASPRQVPANPESLLLEPRGRSSTLVALQMNGILDKQPAGSQFVLQRGQQ